MRVAQIEVLRQPAQIFGVTEEQKAARRQRAREAGHDLLRVVRREIHQHVAAKDDVEALGCPRVIRHQVALFETHTVSNGLRQQVVPTLDPEMLVLNVLGRFAQGPARVASLARALQSLGVQVHRVDRDPPSVGLPRALASGWRGCTLLRLTSNPADNSRNCRLAARASSRAGNATSANARN